VIRGNAELLQLELAGPINSLQRGPVDDIVGASDHLISLVNDVLDLSKMDADRWKLEIERFDARALVEEVVRGFSVAADRRVPLRFNLAAAPPWIEADRRSVRQVLLNLVSNAVKFTDTGSVEVCLRSASGAVVIEVCDTGIGIAPEDLPTLFEPFSQFAKGPEQRGQGTGLGLAITRRLVELHGGAIDVASKRGSGSRFTVRIPQPPRPSAASLELAERAADGREPSIDAVAQLSNLS
jgi:signal transduction histidine kinase